MRILSTLLFSLLLLACNEKGQLNPHGQSENLTIVTQDSLAFVLCEIYGFDQGIRDRDIFMDLQRDLIIKIDLMNFSKFIAIVEKYGYPNEQLLGERNWAHQCVGASATAIMLHNPHRLVNEVEYFNLFLEEVNNGNMDRAFLATVLDKYYWSRSRGQKVMYGSPFGVPCIETKEETNQLRKEIGLDPLNDNEFKVCE